MPGQKILPAIAVLSILGICISSASLYQHYATSKSEYCDFGAKFNCDIVNRSIYSTLEGIPVALIGTFGYGSLAGLALFYRRKQRSPVVLLLASTMGLAFALYLTYVEKFVLAVWCVLCLTSLGLIFTITVFSVFGVVRRAK